MFYWTKVIKNHDFPQKKRKNLLKTTRGQSDHVLSIYITYFYYITYYIIILHTITYFLSFNECYYLTSAFLNMAQTCEKIKLTKITCLRSKFSNSSTHNCCPAAKHEGSWMWPVYIGEWWDILLNKRIAWELCVCSISTPWAFMRFYECT